MKKRKLLALTGSVCMILMLAALPFMAACSEEAAPTTTPTRPTAPSPTTITPPTTPTTPTTPPGQTTPATPPTLNNVGVVTLEVLNPQGEIPTPKPAGALNPRVTDLAGKTIALVANRKAGANLFSDLFIEALKVKVPTAVCVQYERVRDATKAFTTDYKPEAFVHFMGD